MEKPHLGLIYEDGIPDFEIDGLLDGINVDGLRFVKQKRENLGPYAGIEWYIPTAIVLFIGRSYFDSFLKEAGKDHYGALKAAIKRFSRRFSKSKEQFIIGTSGKLKVNPKEYSLLFSVMVDIGYGHKIKFLIKNDITESEINDAVECFARFLETFSPSEEMAEKLPSTILISYSSDSDSLIELDPRSRNQS